MDGNLRAHGEVDATDAAGSDVSPTDEEMTTSIDATSEDAGSEAAEGAAATGGAASSVASSSVDWVAAEWVGDVCEGAGVAEEPNPDPLLDALAASGQQRYVRTTGTLPATCV